jgi:hypothetical protein
MALSFHGGPPPFIEAACGLMRIRAEVVAKREDGHWVFAFAPDDRPELEDAVYEAMQAQALAGGGPDGDQDAQMIESFVSTAEKLARLGIPPDTVPLGWWFGQQLSPETYRRVAVGDQLYVEIE